MSDLQTQFEQAKADSERLPKRPANNDLLKLYALYKQSTMGDVSGERPGILDMQGRMKYDAWSKLRGVAREQAMTDYIALVAHLKASGA